MIGKPNEPIANFINKLYTYKDSSKCSVYLSFLPISIISLGACI